MNNNVKIAMCGFALMGGLMGSTAAKAQQPTTGVVLPTAPAVTAPGMASEQLAQKDTKKDKKAKDKTPNNKVQPKEILDISEEPNACFINSATIQTAIAGKAKKGDTVTIVVKGVPKLNAVAYLGRMTKIPLKEVSAGFYSGSYQVRNAFTSDYDIYARLSQDDKHELKKIDTLHIDGLPAPTVLSIRPVSGEGTWHAIGHASPGSYIAIDVTLDENYLITTSKRYCRLEGFADTLGNYVIYGSVGTDIFTKASMFVLTVQHPNGATATSEPMKLEFSGGDVGGAVTGVIPRLIPMPKL